MSEERHAYIGTGISGEVFVDKALKMTTDNLELTYHIHAHSLYIHGIHGAMYAPCVPECKSFRQGVDLTLSVKSV